MINKKKKTRRTLLALEAGLLLFCMAIYLFDYLLGDGDGIIEKFHLNPLILFFSGQLILIPLLGMNSKSPMIINISLSIFSFLLCLFSLELLLPLIVPNKLSSNKIKNLGTTEIFTKFDTAFFKNYHPNAHFSTIVEEMGQRYKVENKINSLGIRGPELQSKHIGEKRILLLGDSYIQADEVAFERTVGKELEHSINDSTLVIQHGSPSWSPLLQLNWLLKKGPALELDKIILCLYYNDFFPGQLVGDEGYTPFALFDEQGYPKRFYFKAVAKRTAWSQLIEKIQGLWLVRNFKNWLLKRRNSKRMSMDLHETLTLPISEFEERRLNFENEEDLFAAKLSGLISIMRDTSIWDERTLERVGLSAKYLSLMHKWAIKQNIDFAICLIPNPWQFAGENTYTKDFYGLNDQTLPASGLARYISAFCRSNSIPFIDPYPAFMDYKNNSDSLLYFPRDGHFTAEGHKLLANILFDTIKEDHLGE